MGGIQTDICMIFVKILAFVGGLGGSVGWASNFSSGHDVTVREFEPCIGLCVDRQSLERASDSVSPSLSAFPWLVLCLSFSLKNK